MATFCVNCLSKRSEINRKSGQVEFSSDASVNELLASAELAALIAQDMGQKTKRAILSVKIVEVRPKQVR